MSGSASRKRRKSEFLRHRRPALNAMFAPESIAVIGATEAPGSVGRALLKNLKSFRGPIYPVNLKRTACWAYAPFRKLEQSQIEWTWQLLRLLKSLLNACGVPTFTQPDAAARAFCLMAQYSSNLRGLYETPVLVTESAEETHPERVETIVREARETGRTLLTAAEAKEILSSYGIPVVEPRLAEDEEEAVELLASRSGAIALGARMTLSEPHLPDTALSKLVIRPYPTRYLHGWKLSGKVKVLAQNFSAIYSRSVAQKASSGSSATFYQKTT